MCEWCHEHHAVCVDDAGHKLCGTCKVLGPPSPWDWPVSA